MSDKIVVEIEGLFTEIGGHRLSGYAEEAVKLPTVEDVFKTTKGLDSVAWMKQHPNAQELEVSVFLLAESKSIKVLKGFEKGSLIVPFRFEFVALGIYVETLECVVEEKGEVGFNGDMPVIEFRVKIRNFVEMKGLS